MDVEPKKPETRRKSEQTGFVFAIEVILLAGIIGFAYTLRFTKEFNVIKRTVSCKQLMPEIINPTHKDSVIFNDISSTTSYLIMLFVPLVLVCCTQNPIGFSHSTSHNHCF